MKILYDHQIFSYQKYGGISRYFYNLANELHKYNNVKIFSPLYVNNYIKNEKIAVGIHTSLNIRPGVIRRLNQIFDNYGKLIYKPEIIHETFYKEKYVKSDVPRVITIHDMIHELFPNEFSHKDNTAKVKKKSIESADHIICVSMNTRNNLIDIYGVPERKISVVYHGVSSFSLDYNKSYISSQKPFFLYVGKRGGYKNFDLLLNTFSENTYLKNYYNLIAFGDSEFSQEEIKKILRLGLSLESIIHINGSDNILGELYIKAEGLIYPSIYEGFGMPILEAMKYSCPVLSSNTSSLPEVGGNAVIYFDPHNVRSLNDSIELLLNSNKIRLNLIDLGKNRIEKFTWQHCAENTFRVYKKIIK